MKLRFNVKDEFKGSKESFTLFDFVQIAEVIKLNGGSLDAKLKVFTSFTGAPQTIEVEFQSKHEISPQEN